MTDANAGAPAPKKRSFFKRAAWQDAPKKEESDMFSHANEFKDIVAEQQRREDEAKQKAEILRKEKQEKREKKRRKVSNELDSSLITNESASSDRASRTESKARSRTPISPLPSHAPPDSLAARYESLAKSAVEEKPDKPIIVDLGDSDDDGDFAKLYNHETGPDYTNGRGYNAHHVPLRTARNVPAVADDDEVEEVMDPTLAALAARARERANKSQSSLSRTTSEQEKAPIAQLFIDPQMPDANPLMVKIRIDSTLERTKAAWCDRQGYSKEMRQTIIFTWKGAPVYDSTTVKRLGIKIDKEGYISVEGDSNIYDDANPPKVHVEAWTEELFKQRKKEDAEKAAAKKKATEPSPEVEEREPTPEAAPQVKKIRLILKAKGKDELRLSVNPDTTFAHIASAYKQRTGFDESQPITLFFDGDRLSPLDCIMDSEVEDMDALEVHFK